MDQYIGTSDEEVKLVYRKGITSSYRLFGKKGVWVDGT